MAGLIKKLKKPEKQRSEMTEEEQLANPEEGAHEEGFIESVEKFLKGGVEDDPRIAKQQISPGSIEKEAEGAIEKAPSLISKLIDKMPFEKLRELGEEIRTAGSAHVTDEEGNIVHTIGELSPEGKALKQFAREQLSKENSKAPTIYKGFMIQGGK